MSCIFIATYICEHFNMETINVFRKKKETGGTAATIDSLLGSLPTQSQLFIENIQKGNGLTPKIENIFKIVFRGSDLFEQRFHQPVRSCYTSYISMWDADFFLKSYVCQSWSRLLETKEKLNNNAKLTQKDCRNSRTKRANRIIKEEITTFQVKTPFSTF